MVNKPHDLSQVVNTLGLMVRALAEQISNLKGHNAETERQRAETVAQVDLLSDWLLQERDRNNGLVAELKKKVECADREADEARRAADEAEARGKPDREDAERWRKYVAEEREDAGRIYWESRAQEDTEAEEGSEIRRLSDLLPEMNVDEGPRYEHIRQWEAAKAIHPNNQPCRCGRLTHKGYCPKCGDEWDLVGG